ncbi:hypothetical protein ACWDR3_40515 [Streptomyces sp. NPDC001002]
MSADKKLAVFSAVALVVIVGGAVGPALIVMRDDTALLATIFTFVGVLVTAVVSLIGVMVNRRSEQGLEMANRRSEQRLAQERAEQHRQLKLDAAMRAGQLIAPTETGPAHPAAAASGLLALSELGYAELAVALLVDLWAGDEPRISNETAILVVDAALRSDSANSQLMAAELLCRHATGLTVCQSLHWPSALDGGWNSDFKYRTKLLVIEALVRMTTNSPAVEAALRSVAVRLYCIWEHEPDEQIKSCLGKLVKAVIGRLHEFRYRDFVFGAHRLMIEDMDRAAESAAAHPDVYLDKVSDELARQLGEWVLTCRAQTQGQTPDPGSLAAAAV